MSKKILIICFIVSFFSIMIAQDIQYGKASFYADEFEGKATANGEKYSQTKLTAAHLTLAFGTKVRVTNLKNNISVVVRINDRGLHVKGCIIEMSKAAATKLNFIGQEIADVKIELFVENLEPVKNEVLPEESNPKAKLTTTDYYSFQSEKIIPAGYGVQIGSFSEIANFMQISNEIKSEYKSLVIVQIVNVTNVKVYRIILGNYPAKEEAEQLKSKIKVNYPDCFVVEYEE